MFNTFIKKTVVDRESGERVISKQFTSFVQEEEDTQDAIQAFFEQYDRLFFDIPIEGASQSHEVLAKRSGELVNFDQNTEEVENLLEELQALREQNLELEQIIVDLEIQLEGKVSPTTFDKQVEILKESNV